MVKNCSTIWSVSSSRMSIVSVSAKGALPGPVSTIATEVLSEVKVGALIPPKVYEQVELEVALTPRSPQELQDREL